MTTKKKPAGGGIPQAGYGVASNSANHSPKSFPSKSPCHSPGAFGAAAGQASAGILQTHYICPEHCPKFHGCNAPICPIDADWPARSHLKEDSTCFYLTESVKHAAETVFQGAGPGELYPAIVRARPGISARHRRINSTLERAKLTGSRMVRKIGGDHV